MFHKHVWSVRVSICNWTPLLIWPSSIYLDPCRTTVTTIFTTAVQTSTQTAHHPLTRCVHCYQITREITQFLHQTDRYERLGTLQPFSHKTQRHQNINITGQTTVGSQRESVKVICEKVGRSRAFLVMTHTFTNKDKKQLRSFCKSK